MAGGPLRLVVAVVVAALATGCATPEMTGAEGTQVAVAAFARAGLRPAVDKVDPAATVDRAGDGTFIQVHQVDLKLNGRTYQVGVDRRQGAVVRLKEPPDTELTPAQVHVIAAYRHNPAIDRARPRRIVAALVVLAAAATGAYLYLRRERLGVEAGPATDEIPLT